MFDCCWPPNELIIISDNTCHLLFGKFIISSLKFLAFWGSGSGFSSLLMTILVCYDLKMMK